MARKKKTSRSRPKAVSASRKRHSPRARPLVGFIGAGNMARALAGGMIANRWRVRRLLMSDPDPEQRRAVARRLRVKVSADNRDVAARADILVLAVKPQVLGAAVRDIAPLVRDRRPLVISIAAGIRTGDILRWLGADVPLVRAMPNTPALVGSGASALFATPAVSETMRAAAESILRSVGLAVWLREEAQLDAVTALSGSGPAYFFLVMEALERAGVSVGLEPATARLLTLETAYGAAKMALEGAEEPAALRARVTSPGGTTERALGILETGGLTGLFQHAIRGATERARELADTFGKDA